MPVLKKLTTKQILQNNQKRTSPLRDTFILWLHDIRSMHNVGSAFRSADSFGIRELWLSGFTPVPPRPGISKTAIETEEHVAWKQIPSIPHAINELKSTGYVLLGLEQAHGSIELQNYTPAAQNICLVLGNEVTGISNDLLPHLDAAIEIPQFGMKHSLNVSVAAGVALYSFFEKLRANNPEAS